MHPILEKYYEENGRRKPAIVVEDIESLTHLEWLQTRQSGIGGSDAGPVYYEVGHFKSAFDVSVSKLVKITEDPELTPDQIYIFGYGHTIEETLIKWYEAKYKAETFVDRGMYYNPEKPFMYADCDGFARLKTGEVIGLEFKSTMPFNFGKWEPGVHGEDGEVGNLDYLCQVMHYMAVFDLDRYDIVCDFKEGNPKNLKVVTVKRDEAFIESLIEKEEYFWLHMDEVKMPPIKEKKDICEYAKKLIDYRINCRDGDEVYRDLKAIREEKKALKELIDKLTSEENGKLAELAAIAYREGKPILCDDEVIYIVKEHEEKSFDTSKMKKLGLLDDEEFVQKGFVSVKKKPDELKIMDKKKFEREVKKGNIVL